MKKLLIVVLAAFTLFSCQKKDTPTLPVEQEVVFGVSEIDPSGGLKSTDVFDCPTNMNVTHAYIHVLEGDQSFYPKVFRIDGKLYTQAIKFPYNDGGNNTYTIDEFRLVRDVDNNDVYTNGVDVTVMATPTSSGTFKEYVEHPLNVTFDVGEFTKTQKEIEVLCYLKKNHDKFGFNWFVITEIVIREQCFFGDICVKHPTDYTPSSYFNQAGGLKIDMPAIVEIHVTYDVSGTPTHVFGSPFTNNNALAGWGVGAPICIQYPDDLGKTDVYTVELMILVADGADASGFSFKSFKTWTITDAEMIGAGTDGVVDFVLGNCVYSDTDLLLAPYHNLPERANIHLAHSGGYWTSFTVTSVFPYHPLIKYDLNPGDVVHGFCAHSGPTIGGGSHDFKLVTTITPVSAWPVIPAHLTVASNGQAKINVINWMLNNLHLFGYDIKNLTAAQRNKLQDVFWWILHDGSKGAPHTAIFAEALAQTAGQYDHANYGIMPGGWAMVILYKLDGSMQIMGTSVQLLFTPVDP